MRYYDFNFKFVPENNNVLTVDPHYIKIANSGSQFNNRVDVIRVNSTPDEYQDWKIFIIIDNGKQTFEPIEVINKEFVLTDEYTNTHLLKFQVYFEGPNGERDFAPIAQIRLLESLEYKPIE